jgi:cytochrome c-type biogenesis protein CcmH/NrfG
MSKHAIDGRGTESKQLELPTKTSRANYWVGEAIAEYERAVQLRPESAGILSNLAWMLATYADPSLRSRCSRGARAVWSGG